ncbi:MAG: hypothetical protein V1867_02470 [Candidatus Falkowbacteria bacterium]
MKTFRFLLIAAIALSLTGCGTIITGEDGDRSQSLNDDPLARSRAVLISFFNDLSGGRFEEAVVKFAPEAFDAEAWEWIEGFGENSQESRAQALANYCAAVGTCLPVNVIASEEREEGYAFKVNFLNPDGSVFVLGPCCGATEAEMPPVREFEYQVRKLGGEYKVVTPPQYVP